MNWYAPGTGEFVRDVMGNLITKIKSTNNQIPNGTL
jgi:hypothetical protein